MYYRFASTWLVDVLPQHIKLRLLRISDCAAWCNLCHVFRSTTVGACRTWIVLDGVLHIQRTARGQRAQEHDNTRRVYCCQSSELICAVSGRLLCDCDDNCVESMHVILHSCLLLQQLHWQLHKTRVRNH